MRRSIIILSIVLAQLMACAPRQNPTPPPSASQPAKSIETPRQAISDKVGSQLFIVPVQSPISVGFRSNDEIYTVGKRGEIKRWNTKTGGLLGETRLASLGVEPFGIVSISADWHRAVSSAAGFHDEIVLWDVNSGLLVKRARVEGQFQAKPQSAFSPDNRRFAFLTVNKPLPTKLELQAFDADRFVRTARVPIPGGFPRAINFLPGRRVAVTSEIDRRGVVHFVQLSPDVGGEIASTIDLGIIANDVVFTPDARWMAIGSFKTASLWDVDAQRRISEFPINAATASISISSDGSRVLIGLNQGFIELWDALVPRRIGVLEGEPAPLAAVAISPDGRWAASVGWDNQLRIWRLPD